MNDKVILSIAVSLLIFSITINYFDFNFVLCFYSILFLKKLNNIDIIYDHHLWKKLLSWIDVFLRFQNFYRLLSIAYAKIFTSGNLTKMRMSCHKGESMSSMSAERDIGRSVFFFFFFRRSFMKHYHNITTRIASKNGVRHKCRAFPRLRERPRAACSFHRARKIACCRLYLHARSRSFHSSTM